LLPIIGFPHADDSFAAVSRRPYDNQHSSIEPANSDEPLLTVIVAIVLPGQAISCKNFTAAREIKPAF
jgi:hypothetical protein